MLSDLNPFDFFDCSIPDEDPLAPSLDFDDLLDIAREFEFTRTISHIWPCEDEPSSPDSALDDVLAAFVTSIPNAQENPPPLPSSPLPVSVQEIHTYSPRSASVYPASDADDHSHSSSPPKDDDRARDPSTSTLRGWTPPGGSQFLDLDVNLMLPVENARNSPCSTIFLASPSTQSMVAIGEGSTSLEHPPAIDNLGKKSGPIAVQSLTRTILEPVQARSATPNVPTQMTITLTPYAKPSRSRPPPPSAPALGTTNYARAPRGGIPPHIARSVTRANILRVEKERKVMQDAFASTTASETKKPSVLQRAAKAERGLGKDSFDRQENDERAPKRTRV